MAAASRSPNQADARIPCPLCGGLVHPLAGRCKHCKGELNAVRGGTPAAAAALPPIQHKQVAPPVAAPPPAAPPAPAGYDPYARPQSNGQAYAPTPSAYAPHPAGPVHAPPPAQSVLPPRPTGRMYVARRPQGWWKSWPVVVIILAALAIVAAVILMVWPPGGKKDEGRTAPATPAPDRMDTNPLPPRRSSKDPAPSTKPPAAKPPGKIDIPDDPDPWNGPPGGGASGGGPSGGSLGAAPPTAPPDPTRKLTTMMDAVLFHVCDRVKTCGTANAQAFDVMCSTAKKTAPPMPSCAAASRCIEKIAKMACDTDPADWISSATDMSDCMNALHC
jgi:hypothetical protein